tara:strand:+ start:784 stop:1677 length:894 start_codon:yes stop_codon:yes gene_type:complete
MKFYIYLTVLLLSSLAHAGSYLPWRLGFEELQAGKHKELIRIGYLKANDRVKFRGNILYYQGLADSMLNHDPLFEVLTKAGFRVIAFDYMGQGASSGTMNNTTIENINELGDQVIARLGRPDQSGKKRYHLIGWSTGGLATYRKAHQNDENVISTVLIAPGIAPNYLVGEGLFNWPVDEISMRSLTTNNFEGVNDPHEDPIHPNTPLVVPMFAANLQNVAKIARWFWTIPETMPGLVLLSGPNDTYVNAKKTKKVLKRRAPHFKTVTYAGAKHEIDNEVENIAAHARQKILEFLLRH